MNKTLYKLFGLNHFNLFGWIAGGVIVILGAFVLGSIALVQALHRGPLSPEFLMTTAIALLLLGIFGVLLQIYCGLIIENLQRLDAQRRQLFPESGEQGDDLED